VETTRLHAEERRLEHRLWAAEPLVADRYDLDTGYYRFITTVYQWKPSGNRPGSKPMKRWMDCVKEDIKSATVSKFGPGSLYEGQDAIV